MARGGLVLIWDFGGNSTGLARCHTRLWQGAAGGNVLRRVMGDNRVYFWAYSRFFFLFPAFLFGT